MQTRPRNTAHSAHFPALSYYSLSEPSRAKYESARSRAENLNFIWVKPKQHHHMPALYLKLTKLNRHLKRLLEKEYIKRKQPKMFNILKSL